MGARKDTRFVLSLPRGVLGTLPALLFSPSMLAKTNKGFAESITALQADCEEPRRSPLRWNVLTRLIAAAAELRR